MQLIQLLFLKKWSEPVLATRLNSRNYILTKAYIVGRNVVGHSMMFSSQCALNDTCPRTCGQCDEHSFFRVVVTFRINRGITIRILIFDIILC